MTEPSRDPSTDDTTVELPIVRKTDQSCQMEHLQGVVPNGNLMNSLPVSRTISPRNPGTGRSRRPSNVSAAPSPIRSTARLTRGIQCFKNKREIMRTPLIKLSYLLFLLS